MTTNTASFIDYSRKCIIHHNRFSRMKSLTCNHNAQTEYQRRLELAKANKQRGSRWSIKYLVSQFTCEELAERLDEHRMF